MEITANTSKRAIKFLADGTDYEAGDDRAYDVTFRGSLIGTVEVDWLPSATADGTPTKGWAFSDGKGHTGTGATRFAAVIDAYASPEPATTTRSGEKIEYLDSERRYFRYVA